MRQAASGRARTGIHAAAQWMLAAPAIMGLVGASACGEQPEHALARSEAASAVRADNPTETALDPATAARADSADGNTTKGTPDGSPRDNGPAPAAAPLPPIDRTLLKAQVKAVMQNLVPDQNGNSLVRSVRRPEGELRNIVQSVPELREYATSFVLFRARAADEALTRGGRSRASVPAWTIADPSFVWSPAADKNFLVLTGASGEASLVIVLRFTSDSQLEHAASTVVAEKDLSIAVGYSMEHPNELLWTTCYACPGSSGSIVFGDDGRVRFTYR